MINFESNIWTELDGPMSVSAVIRFEGDLKSSKLIRNLMNLCFNHGIGLTSPMLSSENRNLMIFGLKIIIPSNQYAKKYYNHMEKCISTIEDYLEEVERQMDFVSLDISMFSEFDINGINFNSIVNQRDNRFNGSWDAYKDDLARSGHATEANLVQKCSEFEKKNQKDLGIVSQQITNIINMGQQGLFNYSNDKN